MKKIVLILIICILASFAVAKKNNCNCFVGAVRKCGSEASGLECRNDYISACYKRCKEPCFKACNCFLRSVKRCTSSATEEARGCRNAYVKRCFRKCAASEKFARCDASITRSANNSRLLREDDNVLGTTRVVRVTNPCDCFSKAVNRCGAGSSRAARRCRNRKVKSCFAKCTRDSNFVAFCNTSSRSCNCVARSVNKCGVDNDGKTIECRNLYIARCRRRCSALKPAIKSCECFLRSVRKCGAKANAESRDCRNRYVEKCSQRCTSARFFRTCDGVEKVADMPLPPTEELPTIPTEELPPIDQVQRIEEPIPVDTPKENIPKNPIEEQTFEKVRRIYDSPENPIKKLVFSSNKRICVSAKNCDCNTVAKRKCAFNQLDAACFETELNKCNRRCLTTRRCFRLDCQNAGYTRCERRVKKICSKKVDETGIVSESCVTTKTKECRRYEGALCRHAKRIFTYRSQCDAQLSFKCGALTGAGKCQCETSLRQECIREKIRRRRRIIRKYYDCDTASSLLCAEKKCGEYELCVQREKKTCEVPFCEREAREICNQNTQGPCWDENLKKCTERWFKEYCLNDAIVRCDFDKGCIETEKKICDSKVQDCVKDRSFCDDNNECTRDTCDPKIGCINTPITCNDNNACTVDTCDTKKGCVFTPSVTCDTRGLCWSGKCQPATGLCEYVFDRTLSPDCTPNNPPCENLLDCKEWETKQNLKENCQEAVCDNTRGICVAVASRDTQRCQNICQKTCVANGPCETATCVKGETGEFTCERTEKACPTTRKCWIGRCSQENGQCVEEYIPNETECPPQRGCKVQAQCDEFAKTIKDTDCHTVVCNAEKGVCEVAVKTGCKDKSKCELVCKGSNSCETASCEKQGENYVCKKFERPGCQELCEKNCQPSNNCEDAVCKETRDSFFECVRTPKEGCGEGNCPLKCEAKDKCHTSRCVTENGKHRCVEELKTCNDHTPCTVDMCDPKTGNCIYTFIENEKTKCYRECKTDCVAFEKERNLKEKCQFAACNKETKSCEIFDSQDNERCVKKQICEKDCKPRSACETAKCNWNEETKVATCVYEDIKCDDKKECTKDSCDPVRGCQHVFVKSGKCVEECKVKEDCAKLALEKGLKKECKDAICDENTGSCITVDVPNCVPNCPCKSNNLCEKVECVVDKTTKLGYRCVSTTKNCDDNKLCTVDTCNAKTGLCEHVWSTQCCPNGDCVPCERTLDCVKWGQEKKLDEKCEVPVCDTQKGVCVSEPKKTAEGCKFDCKKSGIKCEPRHKCEQSVCTYDANGRFQCSYKERSCDDNNSCTVDTCDKEKGCINKPIQNEKCCPGGECQKCEHKQDCVEWGKKLALGDKCQEAICHGSLCKAVLINNEKCCPKERCGKCQCKPANACETAICHVDAATNECISIRHKKNCDDRTSCTVDSCDPVKGCIHTKIDKCQECVVHQDCALWGARPEITEKCLVAKCDIKTGSCVTEPNPNKRCSECLLACKPRNACESAKCVVENGDYKCVREDISQSCNKGKTCFNYRCDKKKGCVEELDKKKCAGETPCVQDVECKNFKVDKCEENYCDLKAGVCRKRKSTSQKECQNTQCVSSESCPPSKYGTVCCRKDSGQVCDPHECKFDSDCLSKFDKYDKKRFIPSCSVAKDGCGSKCKLEEKCRTNFQCNDGDPCTKDVCILPFGKCKYIKRCVDNTLCTHDICIPGEDGKSFQCRNPVKSCTEFPELLNKNLAELSPADKKKWIGECSHLTGCIKCVVNAQCDDNNGCTEDICPPLSEVSEEQKKNPNVRFCIHKPIHNEWCDPKLKDQPITFQSLADLRNKGILLGYDISKLKRN